MRPLTYTFTQLMGRIVKTPDSVPLLGALSAAASMLTGFIVYQFVVRPDFKMLRLKSNATQGIDKPLDYHGNRLLWLGKRGDETPKEVKDLIKSL